MILTQQINFINHCTKDMDKFELYLSVSDKKITCEPSLALKYYYKWSLKYTYKINLEDSNICDYFNKIIAKEEYKAIGKMEYMDFKNLVVAHYSLGELYFHEGKIDLCKENFNRIINILEETLRSGNKYGHEVMREKDDVSFFELMMWAKKNTADLEFGEKALEQYESVVSENDFLYLQKNYCIYTAAKNLNIINKAYESARNIIKVFPDYENINIDVVSFLRKHKEYYSALEFITNEYKRTGDNQWIDIIKEICIKDANFNIQCVEKVLCFSDILIWNLNLEDWSKVILSLYNAINTWDTGLKHVLNYLRMSFNKITCDKDFSHFPQCISIISKIYEHIRMNKYENKELREYEVDFTIFLLNGALYNKSYCETFESLTKLSSITYADNKIKDLKNTIDDYKKLSIKELTTVNNTLIHYPWTYLKDKLAYAMKQCDFEGSSNVKGMVEKSDENSTFLEVEKNVIHKANQYGLKEVVIDDVSNKKARNNFGNFNNDLNKQINSVTEKINKEESILNNELETLSDSIYDNKGIEDEINTISKEFISKIKGDLQFLKEYGDSKIKIAIPDTLENNLNIMDEFNDVKVIRSLAEEKLKEIISKWCEDNVQNLLWEQFNVYLAKYVNIYLEHIDIIDKIVENRKKVQGVHKDFNNEINEIPIVSKEEIHNRFMNHYNEFLNGISYDIKVLADEKVVDTVTYTMKSIFLNPENKLENIKSRIKLQINEQRLQISDRLIEKVFINLKELEEKLQSEVETLFSDILKEVIKDRSCIEKKYHITKLNHSELKKRNDEIQVLLEFIKVELKKYGEQVSLGILYSNNKCYKI